MSTHAGRGCFFRRFEQRSHARRRFRLAATLLVLGALGAGTACNGKGTGGGGGGIFPDTFDPPETNVPPCNVAAVEGRVSVATDGTEGDDLSLGGSVSADGRFAAFVSDASSLVANDTNGVRDVFVRDRETGETTRVSIASDGSQANDVSFTGSISANGRHVAFQSQASNLVDNDTNGTTDIFVHDRQTGETTRVSVATDGTESDGLSQVPDISAAGRFVAFTSMGSNLIAGDTNQREDIFVHDRWTGETTRVSVKSDGSEATGNATPLSSHAALSADGRIVAFHSWAADLVANDTNGGSDVFVHDRQTGATTRVNLDSGGAQAIGVSFNPAISAAGRFITFRSGAHNLVPDDTNATTDVFVHDQATGETTRVSLDSTGQQGDRSSGSSDISADGRIVAFHSSATNMVDGDTNDETDIFVHDRQTGMTVRVNLNAADAQSPLGRAALFPAISADARFVAFESTAANLVSGDTNDASDVFVAGNCLVALPPCTVLARVSVDSTGAEGDGFAFVPSLNATGRFVVFGSEATTLVPDDTNDTGDIFVHDRQTAETTRVSVASDGAQANGFSGEGAAGFLSATGRFVAFDSVATNLVAVDTNGQADVFVHDRLTGQTTRVSQEPDGTGGDENSFVGGLSADGRLVAFDSSATNLIATPTNPGTGKAFVHDRLTGATMLLSASAGGTEGNNDTFGTTISGDGQVAAFVSFATNLVTPPTTPIRGHVYVRALAGGGPEVVDVAFDGGEGDGDSRQPSLSVDGRFLAFASAATNLVGPPGSVGPGQIYVRDRETGTTELVSVNEFGLEGTGSSTVPSLSADGRFVAFKSSSSNLVFGDTNGKSDIFVRDRATGRLVRLSHGAGHLQGDESSTEPAMSGDGRFVAFESHATNLVLDDTNGFADVFVAGNCLVADAAPAP